MCTNYTSLPPVPMLTYLNYVYFIFTYILEKLLSFLNFKFLFYIIEYIFSDCL